jgi:hypothetical protein
MRLALLALIGACGFTPNSAASGDGGNGSGGSGSNDPMHDANTSVTTADARACYGTGMLMVCFTGDLPATISIPGSIATDTDGNCTKVVAQAGGPSLCVVAAKAIDVTADLRATGGRPLVLVGDTVTVEAGVAIDVSSHNGTNPGADANDSACVAPGTPDADAGGGGGGAGGSFFGKGGDGGVGDDNMTTSIDGTGMPSTATPAVTPTYIRGGCRGGVGGGSSPGQMGRTGASGGGAVYLIGATSIAIAGTIDAGGAGGQATADEQGGPGGGAGGMIGLDAPMISITGGIFANGGGGSEAGATNGTGDGGVAGANGGRSTTTAAAGGFHTYQDNQNNTHPSQGGQGGAGSVGGTHDGTDGVMAQGGGGGGGGGAGYIYTRGTVTGSSISPN